MSIPLLALGPHIFQILPMTLQKIEGENTASWPAVQRFGMGPARQFTGPGDATRKIEGLIFNEEFGGYEDYLALISTQRAGTPVEMVGWGAGAAYAMIMGPVCILKVNDSHEFIGPDGIGRKITFGIEVARFGGDAAFGGGLF